VYLAPGSEPAPLRDVLERLDRAGGLLRHAVAMAIVRKRAPELVFRLVGQEMPRGEGRS
jgi:hypothetical protein